MHFKLVGLSFYRVMHLSAKRGIAIACRPSVCLSVTLVDCDHIGIGWNTSEIISPLVSLGCSLSADPNIMGLLQSWAQSDPPPVDLSVGDIR